MTRALILLAVVLAGCASGAPAPIAYGGREQPPARVQSQVRAQGAEPARTQPPERAPQREADWADGAGPSLSDYALRPEDAHPFDPAQTPQTHQVRRGEKLYDIATAYRLPLRALIDQNNLEPPYALSEGRVLNLPPPRFHTVARGETFVEIARQHSVDTRSLGLLNRMQPPYAVRVGDRIVLPAMARAEPERSGPTQPLALQTGRFAWPLQGEISGRFGRQQGGRQLDGVEIAGTVGASVKAAADGQVVFAGESVPNHGVIVLIAHAENYVTAYAYNRRALVREGQAVRRGETIAELGQRPGQPARLMFQVRLEGVVVDPTPLLGAR